MTVQQLIAYHTIITVFRIWKCKKPEYLFQALGRDNRNGHIIVENRKLGLYKNSFVPRGSVLWNKLPGVLKTTKTVGRFKSDLRKWVAENVKNLMTSPLKSLGTRQSRQSKVLCSIPEVSSPSHSRGFHHRSPILIH